MCVLCVCVCVGGGGQKTPTNTGKWLGLPWTRDLTCFFLFGAKQNAPFYGFSVTVYKHNVLRSYSKDPLA